MKRKLEDVLSGMGDDAITALMRTAKSRKHGLLPFFANPKTMQVLRGEAERRNLTPIDAEWRRHVIDKTIGAMTAEP
jgi:hypothetical protein